MVEQGPAWSGSIWRRRIAIALLSAAAILFQVAITRVLSVVLWYHFAFLSVTLAMLGLGVPGIWFALKPPGSRALQRALVLSAIALPLSVAAICKGGASIPRSSGLVRDVGSFLPPDVVLVVASVLAVMLPLGAAVCILLLEAKGREVGRTYAADLVGAAVGAAVVVPLLGVVATPAILAACGLLPIAAAMVLGSTRKPAVLGTASLIVASLAWGEPYKLRYTKSYDEQGAKLYERWTPTARLAVFDTNFFGQNVFVEHGWGMGANFRGAPTQRRWLEQDGSAGTPIIRFDDPSTNLEHLLFDVTSVGYQLRNPKRVCIIGVGGGRDVHTARLSGATHIDGVELNGGIVDLISGPMGQYSGDVYNLPGVQAHVSEGRSFLTRAKNQYDLIQISLIDSWAATAAGAFALSENYLYTLEAFRLYFSRLSPDGILSVSRWFVPPRHLEASRLLLLARESLEREGVADSKNHLAVIQSGAVGTLLVSRKPFDDHAIQAIDRIVSHRGFQRLWPLRAGEPSNSFAATLLANGKLEEGLRFVDISPPTDDRPFFFQSVPLFQSRDTAMSGDSSSSAVADVADPNVHAVLLLRWLWLVVSGLAALLFFVPFLARGRLGKGPGLWTGSGYFAAVGIAFMLVEVGWIQRFILYLGHPSYATTVVLAALLCGAGIGSALSARAPHARHRLILFVLPAVIAGSNLVFGPLFAGTLGWPIALRVLLSFVMLVGVGCLMGFPFPAGMIHFLEEQKAWFWAVNGFAGVLASVSSLGMAMVMGFQQVVFAGVVFYLLAATLLTIHGRRTEREKTDGIPDGSGPGAGAPAGTKDKRTANSGDADGGGSSGG